MMANFKLITKFDLLPSPMREKPSERKPLRVALVQSRWYEDANEHKAVLEEGIRLAASQGAKVICLQELTLSPYFAITADAYERAQLAAESIPDGPTTQFAKAMAAETGAAIHASLYEKDPTGGIGFNTAICVAPDGMLLARTRKLHIPRFPGYYEDIYFAEGDTAFPVAEVMKAKFGFPTCWDQWNPELARIYSLEGAEVLVYPTAIGNELNVDFDSQAQWQHMITANGLANATFMIAVNRIGAEGDIKIKQGMTFYGSSFISDPYGRVLVQAPRNEHAVLVADLDLDQRRDWLGFGLFQTRRPELYKRLTDKDLGVGAKQVPIGKTLLGTKPEV
jgi:N-carbamoylputrescine amidase